MAKIFSLFGEIFIDNQKASKSIDDIKNKGESTSKSFSQRFGEISKTAIKVGTAVVGVTTGIVAGFTALSKSTADTYDAIDKGSIRMGISTKSYQELQYAAGQCGVEMSTLEKAAKKLEGTDINLDDAMNQIMALGTAEERAKKASELFGDNIAYTLSPLIEQSGEDFKGLKDRANELGLVVGDDAVKAGVEFGDTLSDLQQSFGGIKNRIANALMPIITKVMNLIIKSMPTIIKLIDKIVPILSSLLDTALPPLMELAQTLLPIILNLIEQLIPFIESIISTVLPIIIDLINMLLPPLVQIIEMILPLLIQLIEPLLPLLQPILELLQPLIDLLMAVIEPLIQILNVILPPLITLLTNIFKIVLPALKQHLTFVASILKNTFGTALAYVKKQVSLVIDVFKNIIDFIKNVFTGNWKGAWQNVKNIFGDIISGLANMFKTPINYIIDGINIFIKGLNKIEIPDWVPGVGGKGLNLQLLKKLRVGIEYVPYDEMPALLHKGETVLSAEEAQEYRNNKYDSEKDSKKIYNFNNQIVVEKLDVREENDIKRIAEELYYLQKKEVHE